MKKGSLGCMLRARSRTPGERKNRETDSQVDLNSESVHPLLHHYRPLTKKGPILQIPSVKLAALITNILDDIKAQITANLAQNRHHRGLHHFQAPTPKMPLEGTRGPSEHGAWPSDARPEALHDAATPRLRAGRLPWRASSGISPGALLC